MPHYRLALGLLLICLVSGCGAYDDVSSVAAADRPALEQCLAAPDLPGNQWTAGAAKARCWLIPRQDPSLQEITATLGEPDGAAKLDRRYRDILAAHYHDSLHRDVLFRAYLDFERPQGRLVAANWLAKSPRSPFAQMAAGDAALGAASTSRGTAHADKTSQAQFDGMFAQLKIAVPLLQSALRAEPTLSPACVDLMRAGLLGSDESVGLPAKQQCLKVDPLSMHVVQETLLALYPGWGGSYDQLDAAVAQIRTHVAQNPLLGSLLARGIGRRAQPTDDDSRLAPFAAQLDEAALAAPDPFYIAEAGEAAHQAGNDRKALEYLSQALRFDPDNLDFLVQRAEIREKMGDNAGSRDDARKAAAAPGEPCGCSDFVGLAVLLRDLFRKPDEERVALQKAIAFNHDREEAMQMLCETYFSGFNFDSEHGLPCTKEFAEDYPGNSSAMYFRALSLYIVHDPAATEFDARYRKLTDPNDPNVQHSIAQLDQIKNQ